MESGDQASQQVPLQWRMQACRVINHSTSQYLCFGTGQGCGNWGAVLGKTRGAHGPEHDLLISHPWSMLLTRSSGAAVQPQRKSIIAAMAGIPPALPNPLARGRKQKWTRVLDTVAKSG
jgi:hypothetical protein